MHAELVDAERTLGEALELVGAEFGQSRLRNTLLGAEDAMHWVIPPPWQEQEQRIRERLACSSAEVAIKWSRMG